MNTLAFQVIGQLISASRESVRPVDEVHSLFTLLEELMPSEEMTALLTEMSVGTHLIYNVPVPGLPKQSEFLISKHFTIRQ